MSDKGNEGCAVAVCTCRPGPCQYPIVDMLRDLYAKHPIVQDAADKIERLHGQVERLSAGLSSALGYMRNADIDLATGAPKKTAQATLCGGIKAAEHVMAEHGNSALTSTVQK